VIDDLGVRSRWWDPYGPHVLKGDRPLVGDWFMSLDARSQTDVWMRSEEPVRVVELATLDLTWMKSQARVRPPPVTFRVGGSFRASNVETGDLGITAWGIQNASIDVMLARTSAQYDFLALRVGQQPMSSDPRGLLLRGAAPGARLYGTAWGNRLQFSLAWARLGGTSPFLGLTRPAQLVRPHDAFLATVYLRDLPVRGLEVALVALYDRSRGEQATPWDRISVGGGLDGHIGRLGIGSLGMLMVRAEQGQQVLAGLGFVELGVDVDWARPRVSALWLSGDRDGDTSRGAFLPALEAPQISALQSSVWLAGLSGRPQQLVPVDASSGTSPGLWLAGLGTSLELHPTLTLTADVSALGFPTSAFLGVDMSMGLRWRPWLNEVLRLHLDGGAVASGDHMARWIGSDATPFSARGSMVWAW
jgi:hypothetical protein